MIEPTLNRLKTVSTIGATMAPCVTSATRRAPRVFGLSLLFRYGAIAKPYFAAGDVLTHQERGCIGRSLRGLTITGSPHSAVNEYKVRVDPTNEITYDNRDRIVVAELDGQCMPHPLQPPPA